MSNYTKQAESARADFIKWDQSQMAQKLSLEHDEDYIYIDFFGERHSVDRKTGEVTCGGERVSFEAIMTIYDVLCYSKNDAKLSGTWQTISNLSPHSNFGASGTDLSSRAAGKFSGKLDELKRACVKLGGREATSADVGFEFNAFPFLPIIFQFWDGDEEFQPKLRFLMDANALDYLHFETAWYVSGYLTELLEKNVDG